MGSMLITLQPPEIHLHNSFSFRQHIQCCIERLAGDVLASEGLFCVAHLLLIVVTL